MPNVAIFSMVMPDEFEASKVVYSKVMEELSKENLALFVLLNGKAQNFEVIKNFFKHPKVNFYHSDVNLGVAGGRNFLIKRAIEKEFELFISFDNDFIFPRNYFEKISNFYLEIKQLWACPLIISPALIDYWVLRKVNNNSEVTAEVDQLSEVITESLVLRNKIFYHFGINDWVDNYISSKKEVFKIFLKPLKKLGFLQNIHVYNNQVARRHHLLYKIIKLSQPLEVDCLPGGSSVYDLDTIKKIGLFDEKFNPFGFEDADFCIRAKRIGSKNFIIPNIFLIHDIHERNLKRSTLFKYRLLGRSKYYLFRNHCGLKEWPLLIDIVLTWPLINFLKLGFKEPKRLLSNFFGTFFYLFGVFEAIAKYKKSSFGPNATSPALFE